jgi:isoleucyl-tRNA synthetase
VTYANLDGWTPDQAAAPVAERDVLDRWILAELNQLVRTVTDAYEHYDAPRATRPIEEFVDGLSNWYVRLSRRRFWNSENDAYATLYECLVTVSHLLAPAIPFLSESLYRNLVAAVRPDAPDSVHLAAWPTVNEAVIDDTLMREMELVRQLVSMGLAARNSVELGVRQPLASVSFGVSNNEERRAVMKYEALIRDELNVKQVATLQEDEGVTSYTLSPNFAKLGKKLRNDVKTVANALKEASAEQIASWGKALLHEQTILVEVDGKSFELAPDEVEVRQESAAEGYVVFEEKGYLAALDTNLTPDLINERIAREVVRRIQTSRKDADFQISDRIEIVYQASERLHAAIQQFAGYVQSETLANRLEAGSASDGYHTQDFTSDLRGDLDGETLILHIRRVV